MAVPGHAVVLALAVVLGCGEQPGRAVEPAEPGPGQARPALAAAPEAVENLAGLVEAVKGAVVNVDVRARPRRRAGPTDLFDLFHGRPGELSPGRMGMGSGVLIDPRGRVLTNSHVVEGADDIRVRLEDGRSFRARVLGRDPLTDLALLQLEGKLKDLPTVPLGDSGALRVGEWVVAIGNPFGLASSVSAGILSAKERVIGAGPFDDFLQTDAAINPGNSGGPLFNLKGEVVGINTAIVGGGAGIGFAVPSAIARALLPQLERGQVERGWLGVGVQDLTPELAGALNVPVVQGALLTEVVPGTPGHRAGLRPDDVVVALEGREVDSARALTRGVAFLAPDSRVTLTLYRGGARSEVPVHLGRRPEPRVEPAPALPEPAEGVGLRVAELPSPDGPRVMITAVAPGSPAEEAGLIPGMLVLEAAGKPVRTVLHLARALKSHAGKNLLLRVALEERPSLVALPVP